MPEDTQPTKDAEPTTKPETKTAGPADANLAELEAAVARNPADGEAWGRLGLAYGRAEAFDLALPAFENAVRLSPDDATFWFGLARTRLETDDDMSEALSAALRAVELDPRQAFPRLTLARVVGRIGMVHQAIFHLQQGIGVDPRWPPLYNDLGHAHLFLCEFEAAREAFRMSLFLDPEQPDLWHPLAYSCLRLENWQAAARTLEQLVSHSPADALAWARLGTAYCELGRTDEGARALTKGLDLGLDEPWVWYEAGRAAAALRDGAFLDKARDVLKEKDAELACKLDAWVRESDSTATEAGHGAEPAPAEGPARDAETASC
jgi:cytochrome c-type biogenesis protein CcmH/NrfG